MEIWSEFAKAATFSWWRRLRAWRSVFFFSHYHCSSTRQLATLLLLVRLVSFHDWWEYRIYHHRWRPRPCLKHFGQASRLIELVALSKCVCVSSAFAAAALVGFDVYTNPKPLWVKQLSAQEFGCIFWEVASEAVGKCCVIAQG